MTEGQDTIRGAGLEPVRPPSVTTLIIERLQRAIHLGTFAPGERLPAERELSRHLGVSRSAIREAMGLLQEKGYLVSRRGIKGGWFVRPPGDATAALRQQVRDSTPALDQILDFRVAVEGMATRLAATSGTESEFDRLEASIREMRAGGADLARFRRADNSFHLGIAGAARNSMLRDAVEEARATMFLVLDALDFSIKLAGSVEAHEAILDALRRRDPDLAQSAAIAHVEGTRQEMRHVLWGEETGR